MREVDSLALANVQQDLQAAYRNFFRDPTVGFPKFKRKHTNRCSYKTNNQKGTVAVENGYLKLPKLKSLVRIKLHRPFSGTIKSVTISKTPTNKYYASILVEENEQLFPKLDTRVGIDRCKRCAQSCQTSQLSWYVFRGWNDPNSLVNIDS